MRGIISLPTFQDITRATQPLTSARHVQTACISTVCTCQKKHSYASYSASSFYNTLISFASVIQSPFHAGPKTFLKLKKENNTQLIRTNTKGLKATSKGILNILKINFCSLILAGKNNEKIELNYFSELRKNNLPPMPVNRAYETEMPLAFIFPKWIANTPPPLQYQEATFTLFAVNTCTYTCANHHRKFITPAPKQAVINMHFQAAQSTFKLSINYLYEKPMINRVPAPTVN